MKTDENRWKQEYGRNPTYKEPKVSRTGILRHIQSICLRVWSQWSVPKRNLACGVSAASCVLFADVHPFAYHIGPILKRFNFQKRRIIPFPVLNSQQNTQKMLSYIMSSPWKAGKKRANSAPYRSRLLEQHRLESCGWSRVCQDDLNLLGGISTKGGNELFNRKNE